MTGEIPLFGFYHGEPILPPSRQRESMTIEQLQEKYPLRYKLYSRTGIETENNTSAEAIARRLQMLNNLDRYIAAHGKPGRGRVLREKQLAVFRDTSEFLETGETEGFVEAPTGFGKTVLFSEIIKATDQKTLVVVPSRILVEQTYRALRKFNPSLNTGRYYTDKKERDRQVTVTTYQSLVRSCGGVNPQDIDLLILDEVHQSLTNIRIQAVGQFVNPVKLGFTATPEYTQDKRVENLLNNEIHNVTLREAVETGLLCSFSVYIAETEVDLSGVKINPDGDYDKNELEEAINIFSRNKSAVELYKELNERHSGLSKAVAYCISIRHAQEVAKLFNDAGIRAEAVWSNQEVEERNRIIDAYRKGEIKVLTNVNILTEGFDDPQASLCLNLRPTLSKVIAKQRGGRVLRLDPDNPKKHSIVVDYLDKNEDKCALQVTFAEVAEGAKIINPVMVDTDKAGKNGSTENGGDKVLIDRIEPFNLEGLHVITNSQEVLRIVRELEILRNQPDIEDLKESDLALTINGLKAIFISASRMSPLVSKVKNKLQADHPEYFVVRKNQTRIVDAVTYEGKDEFIKALVAEGKKLRGPLEEVKDTDLQISFVGLRKAFRGDGNRLLHLAKEVREQLSIDHPEYFIERRNSISTRRPVVDIVTTEGEQAFIEAMKAKGAEVRVLDLCRVQQGDMVLSHTALSSVFIGEGSRLGPLKDFVKSQLLIDHPEYFVQRISGTDIVEAVTQEGRENFINTMIANGASLRDLSIKQVQEEELSLGISGLYPIFKGDQKRIISKAKEVRKLLESDHPEYFANRRNGTRIISVVTKEGRDTFIQKMIAFGAKFK